MIRCRQLQWGPPGQPLIPPLAPYLHPEERSMHVLIALLASLPLNAAEKLKVVTSFRIFADITR